MNCPAHIHTPLKSGEKRCWRCRETRNNRNIRHMQRGMCPSHTKEPVISGTQKCNKCRKHEKNKIANRKLSGLCDRHSTPTPVEPGKARCRPCLDRGCEMAKKWLVELKKEIFQAYGGARCACPNCDNPNPGIPFLSIDHINNDGAEHRRQLNGKNMYGWIKKNGFPKGFQVLCFNCNGAKGYSGKGVCPHNLAKLGDDLG